MVHKTKHKSKKARRHSVPWPRNYISQNHEGHCPHCHKPVKNIEAHIRAKHKDKKPVLIKGELHGHE